jgi:mono/diheme cytochrome c family protein
MAGRRIAIVFFAAALVAGSQTPPAAPPNNRPSATPPSRMQRGRDFLGLAPPADAEATASGQKLFAQSCGFCHGPNATGAEGPDLLRSSVVLHDEKGELIGQVVLKGRPDKGMPAFATMSPQQIYDISEFLHSRVEAAANRYGYKMQNVVTGDAKAGEAYFNGAGQCGQCHSSSGDLAHIASKFDAAALQAQFLYPDRPEPKREVTVTLPSGQTVSGTLKHVDDFDISLYDSAGEYHSWPRAGVTIAIKDPLTAHRELLAKYSDADMHNLLAYLVTLK